ncbi:MAG: protein kinase [Myxococcales bacterium]|nr:protein kinase [Myxococcales bacterium]
MPLSPGQVINDTYRIERLLGAGGMAEVYVAAHTRLPRRFAIKVMNVEASQRAPFLARFRREAEILGMLRNPHIVDITDWNALPDGSPYLVMELLDGEDLAALLGRQRILPLPQALALTAQIGEALAAAHGAGVVHRDLKPGNIFLCRNGAFPQFVKVLDFGIAKLAQVDRTPLTANASLMGTPGYMAPEQALGKANEVDARSDQFALAAIVYEMLAGQPAFFRPGDSVFNILERVIHEDPPPLNETQASAAVSRAVKRGLSKNREARFPSVPEFLAAAGATRQLAYGQGAVAAPPITVDERAGELTHSPGTRRKIYVASLVGVALTALLGGSYAIFGRDVGSEPSAPQPRGSDPALAPSPVASPPSTPRVGPAPVHPAGAAESLGPLAAPGSAGVAVQPAAGPPSDEAEPSAPETAASLNKASSAKSGGKPGKAASPRRFVVTGTRSPAQDLAVTICARKELAQANLATGAVIKLERSGTLQIVEAPAVVHQTGFGACLRQALANFPQHLIPSEVTVRVGK